MVTTVRTPPRPPASRPGPPPTARRPLQPGEQPPLRLRWDRISLLGTAVVLTVLAVARLGGHSAAANEEAAPAPAARPASVVPAVAVKRPPACAGTGAVRRSAPGVAGTKTVALTFDDGPGAQTHDVLEVLAREHVHATFFVIGSQAAHSPATVRAVLKAGHLIGNHSWTHHLPAGNGWAAATVRSEIDRTQTLLTRIGGTTPCLFRPPGGVVRGAAPAARAASVDLQLWSVDTQDWRSERDDATHAAAVRIVAQARAGLGQTHPVILMHDGGGDRRAGVEALPAVIRLYRSAGYAFVRADGSV